MSSCGWKALRPWLQRKLFRIKASPTYFELAHGAIQRLQVYILRDLRGDSQRVVIRSLARPRWRLDSRASVSASSLTIR